MEVRGASMITAHRSSMPSHGRAVRSERSREVVTMEVRELRGDEGPAYREVRLRALREAPESFASSFDDEASEPESAWSERAMASAEAMESATFVLDRGNGELGGTVYVHVQPAPPHDTYVGAMWVDRDLRSAGWAEALLEAAERFAARLGSESAELWVEAANERARRFFVRAGYQETAVRQPAPQGGTAMLYQKALGIG